MGQTMSFPEFVPLEPSTNPFFGWGDRIRGQAGCTPKCATVRYSEIEGIVVIRHEGFQGPIIKLHEDDWDGRVAAVRESTAITLLARKHLVWIGKAPNGADPDFDWDAALDKQLDGVRFAGSRGRIESRDVLMLEAADEAYTYRGHSGSIPKERRA
jgi:hypothetical protein